MSATAVSSQEGTPYDGSAPIVQRRSVPNRSTSTVCQTYRLADHKPGDTASVGSMRDRTSPKTATLRTHCPTRLSKSESAQSKLHSAHWPLRRPHWLGFTESGSRV